MAEEEGEDAVKVAVRVRPFNVTYVTLLPRLAFRMSCPPMGVHSFEQGRRQSKVHCVYGRQDVHYSRPRNGPETGFLL